MEKKGEKRSVPGGAQKKRDKKKKMLLEDAKKCTNIKDIFNQQAIKSNVNTAKKELDSQSDTSDKKSINIIEPLFVEPTSSVTNSINKNQSNTIIFELQTFEEKSFNGKIEFPIQNLTTQAETIKSIFDMFTKPKPNELQAFFKYHPIQVLDNNNQTKINIKKTFYRPDGTIRNWLSFSKSNNAFYCTVCLAFSKINEESKFISGLTEIDPKHLYSRIDEHENSKNHFNSSESYMMHSKEKTIDVLLFKDQLTIRMKEVKERRQAFERIVDVVKLIGKRGISARGAYESAKDLSNPNVSHGNFLDIVLLLAKYDVILNSHVKSVIDKANKNKTSGRSQQVTLLSKTTINYIVKSISKLIKMNISNEIQEAGFYSIQIDTTQDISVTDICSVIIRYISLKNQQTSEPTICERAISFLSPKKTTGEALCNLVSNNLLENNMDIKKCIGSSTDGASNMIGQYKGFSSWLEKESPNQVHVWCYAHCLNLIILEATSTSTAAVSLFGLLNSCASFFRDSHKRMDVWRSVSTDNRVLNLIGQTRWWAKDVALKKIFGLFNDPSNSLYITVLNVLLIVSSNNENFNSDTRSTANSLLKALMKYETVMTAQLFLKIFSRTTPLSKYLQTEGMYILQAQLMTDSTVEELKKEARNFKSVLDSTNCFVSWANNKLEEYDIDLVVESVLPTIRIPKKNRNFGENNVSKTPIEKFEHNVHNVALDIVISKLEQRFYKHSKLCADFACLDPRNFSNELPSTALVKLSKILGFEGSVLKDELLDFASKWDKLKLNLPETYLLNREEDDDNDDAVEDIDESRIIDDGEINQHRVEKCFEKKRCLSCLMCCYQVLFKYRLYVSSYNHLFTAYKYILTLSCTQIGCERSFSTLTYIKTRLRNRLSLENLESWMIMNLNKDLLETISFEDILHEVVQQSTVLKNSLIV